MKKYIYLFGFAGIGFMTAYMGYSPMTWEFWGCWACVAISYVGGVLKKYDL